MKFSTPLLGTALLASAAVAAPLTAQRQARNAARRGDHHGNLPIKTREENGVQYSSNWAGAVLVGSGYNKVTAEFVVPEPSVPSGSSGYSYGYGYYGSGGSSQYCASAWVGIDGDTCTTAILQTGVDFCVTSSGSVSYSAWYEWYPNYAYDFSGISISTGDTIRVTVDASSLTSGTATLENLSSGQTVSHTFTGETAGSLCETNAEWIVEDFESGSSLVPFADFGTVTFTNAYATQSGSQVGPAGAQLMDIEQNGSVLTSVSAGSSDVTVTYV